MSNDRKRIADLFCVAGAALSEIGVLMGGTAVTGATMTDAELDEHADVRVSFDVRAWKGAPMKGRRLSECPPKFLSLLADALDDMAASPKEGKEKYASANRRTAKIARAWAERLRRTPAPADAPTTQADPPPATEAPEESVAPDAGDGDWQ